MISASLKNAGQLSPGNPIGTLSISGTYTQTSTGVMNIDLGGLTAGTQFDQVAVTGAATIGGTLNLALANGFSPAASNAFKVLTYGSRSGTFATVNTPSLAGSLALTASYNPSDLTFTTTLAPSGASGNAAQPALVVASSSPSSSVTDQSRRALSSPTAGNPSAQTSTLQVIDLALRDWRALWPRSVRRVGHRLQMRNL